MARSAAIATDNFNRAGPAIGSNWQQLLGYTTGGSVYIVNSANFSFDSASGNGCAARWVGAGTFSADQWSSAVVAGGIDNNGTNYRIGAIARGSDPGGTDTSRDFYCCEVQMNGTGDPASRTTRLFKVVNGTETQLASASISWGTGDRVEIECEGTTIRGCKNGTLISGAFEVTDSALASGQPGVWGAGGTVPFGDDWEAGDITASGIELAAAATAAATGAGALSVEALLAANAVGAAIGAGTLNATVPLTAAAIASALGSATLEAFTRVWRIPTNVPNGQQRHVIVLAGTAPNYSVVVQGPATVAGGFMDIPATATPGAKAGAIFGNWDDDTDTVSIRGGWAIATVTDL